ncbi:MAG: thiamine phosphate synthase [Terriglobia bacterium]
MLPPVYPILDSASILKHGLGLVEAAEALLEGGAQILQLRHKEFWSKDVVAAAQKIADLCTQSQAMFVVNDRADIAALTGSGLHIGQDDLMPEDARRVIGVNSLLGFSTHNDGQMRAAQSEPVDYFAFGPVFSTVSKARPDPTAGIDGLRAARAFTSKPLVAIGGITRDNAGACWDAGASSVAVIADLIPVPCTRRALRERMAEWRRLR